MSFTLTMLQKQLDELKSINMSEISDIEYVIDYLNTEIDRLKTNKLTFFSLLVELTKDESKLYEDTDYIVEMNYNKKVNNLEDELRCKKEELKQSIDKKKKEGTLSFMIREIRNLVEIEEMEHCNHENTDIDGTFEYCIDCSKNIRYY